MIDPYDITNFNRTNAELEEFWLFSICVAGKGADQQRIKLDAFLSEVTGDLSPFQKIEAMIKAGTFEDNLRKHKLGQYSRIARAFTESLPLNLYVASLDDLEGIFGVSFKTSRFFLMHSRPNLKVAALDTHILKYLNDNGIEAPKNTPSSPKLYRALEEQFIRLAESVPNRTIAEIDLMIWSHYASKQEGSVVL
jgi:hypothetical protein